MKMHRVMIQLPAELKAQLQAMRGQGTTISGYVRSLIERALHERGGR
jgi:predicted DNA-binding protein